MSATVSNTSITPRPVFAVSTHSGRAYKKEFGTEVTKLELESTKLELKPRDWDDIGMGKDNVGQERTDVNKNGTKRP